MNQMATTIATSRKFMVDHSAGTAVGIGRSTSIGGGAAALGTQ
jgi:hypothetical protein